MQQFKAKDKITQKMTRDGVVETNKATGEQTRTSSREAETDYTEKSTAEKVIDKASDSAGKRKAGKQAKKATKDVYKRQTKHPRYKYLSDYDKKNAFDVESYLKRHPAVVKPDEPFDLYEMEV